MKSAGVQTGAARHCFDRGLATSPTRLVPIGRVIDPLPVTHRPDRIAEYRLAMERGDRFPPISVLPVGRRYLIADGHKRFAAYRSLGATGILVEVWTMRRWLGDQWRQLMRKTRQQWFVVTRSPVDRQVRAQAVRLFWDTIGHWQRMIRSLAYRAARPRRS